MAVLIFFCYVRFLKFLQIPPYIGPIVQTIFDTLLSYSLFIFGFLFFMFIWIFALAYQLAFGSDVSGYKDFTSAWITIFRGTAGNDDYNAVASQRFLGPFLYIIFTYFMALIVQNMFVAVLSEAYTSLQARNLVSWDRFITKLMISDLESEFFLGFLWRGAFTMVTWMDDIFVSIYAYFWHVSEDDGSDHRQEAWFQMSEEDCEKFQVTEEIKEQEEKVEKKMDKLEGQLNQQNEHVAKSSEQLVRLESQVTKAVKTNKQLQEQIQELNIKLEERLESMETLLRQLAQK